MTALRWQPSHPTLLASLVERAVELLGTNAEDSLPPFHDDPEVWLHTMFPNHASRGFGAHHLAYWEWLWSVQAGEYTPSRSEIWSRAAAKSTSAELSVAVLGARGARRYGLYVSGTQRQADDHVQNVQDMLEQPQVGEWYPGLAVRAAGKYGQSRGWRRNRISTPRITLDAVGLDTAARGAKHLDTRPDFFILDDLDSESDTPAITRRKLARLTRALLPTGTDDALVIAVQNLMIPDGIFARLLPGYVGDDRDGTLLADRIAGEPVPALYDMTTRPDPDNPARTLVDGTPLVGGHGRRSLPAAG
jgi:hypothetical protein